MYATLLYHKIMVQYEQIRGVKHDNNSIFLSRKAKANDVR